MDTDVQQSSSALPDPRVLTPQIEQSFRQLPISLTVNLVNGFILVLVLWNAVRPTILVGWYVLLTIVTGARFLTLRSFRRQALGTAEGPVAWSRGFVAGAAAAGVVWGASGVLLFHPDSFPHQVFLAFVLGGMTAGAVPLLSSVRFAYWLFAVPILVPITLRMLYGGDPVHLIMALMIVIFGIAMLASSVQVHRLFRDAERLRRDLISSLELGRALEHLARLDSLTGIPNRRFFEEELTKEWARAERNRSTLAVIIADIDHFKEYNDRYGHPAGDGCLIEVARAMQRALARPGDVVARIGGEEFAFLLPRTNLHGAISVAEQVRENILALNLPHEASPVSGRVTLSFGVSSTADADVRTPADLIRASDAALYEAKRRGRSQIAPAL